MITHTNHETAVKLDINIYSIPEGI